VDDSPGSGEDEIVEPEQGNGIVPAICRWKKTKRFPRDGSPTNMGSTVLLHIISQLRPGADLSRVVLPTFILEPRSMLERITKYVRPFRSLSGQRVVAAELTGFST
jgi:hypothetical protein